MNRLQTLLVATVGAVSAALCFSARAAERVIEKSVLVAATLDQAWEAWTTREGIVAFMAPDAKIDARPGGAFQIYFDPQAAPGARGADDMRFMALQPKRMLSFDWNAPPSLPQARDQRTFVIVRFAEAEGATRVSLFHAGWGDGGEWDRAYAYFDRAWGNVLNSMKRRFEQGPQDWSPWLEQLRKAREGAPAAPKGG